MASGHTETQHTFLFLNSTSIARASEGYTNKYRVIHRIMLSAIHASHMCIAVRIMQIIMNTRISYIFSKRKSYSVILYQICEDS